MEIQLFPQSKTPPFMHQVQTTQMKHLVDSKLQNTRKPDRVGTDIKDIRCEKNFTVDSNLNSIVHAKATRQSSIHQRRSTD